MLVSQSSCVRVLQGEKPLVAKLSLQISVYHFDHCPLMLMYLMLIHLMLMYLMLMYLMPIYPMVMYMQK